MKATGIVRRVDDLGRIVIPKEIRWNEDVPYPETCRIIWLFLQTIPPWN